MSFIFYKNMRNVQTLIVYSLLNDSLYRGDEGGFRRKMQAMSASWPDTAAAFTAPSRAPLSRYAHWHRASGVLRSPVSEERF